MLSLKPPGFFGGPVPATALAPAEADGGAPVTPAAPDSTGAVEQPAARGAAAQHDSDGQEAEADVDLAGLEDMLDDIEGDFDFGAD